MCCRLLGPIKRYHTDTGLEGLNRYKYQETIPPIKCCTNLDDKLFPEGLPRRKAHGKTM